jgi:hypothetical protein
LTLLFESPKNARIADFGTCSGQNWNGIFWSDIRELSSC